MNRRSLGLLVGLGVLMAAVLLVPGLASATKLCKEKALTCPGGQVWLEKTELEAKLKANTKSIFEAGKFNEKGEFELIYKIECNESVATGKTTNNGGGVGVPVLADIENVTFQNNKGNCPVSKELGSCAITALGRPYAGLLEYGGITEGVLRMTEKGGAGVPRLQFSCLGGTVTCIYGKNVISLRVTGGQPWFASTFGERLDRLTGSSGLCPVIAFWDASYEGVKPAKAFLSEA